MEYDDGYGEDQTPPPSVMYFDSSADMIAAFGESTRPLDTETISIIARITLELQSKGIKDEWAAFRAECRICCHEEMTICPATADFDSLECANCGAMASMPQEISEWGQ